MDKASLICLLFCPAFFSLIHLWLAVNHLFKLGKSKTKVRKEKKEIGFVEKILLIGYAKKCKYYNTTANMLCNVYWLYIITFFCGTILSFISMMIPMFGKLASTLVIAKVVVLDIPINIYSLIMTKHNKRGGGVVWRWEYKS